MPSQRFFWMMQLYKLQKAGYTIDNNELPLSDWLELGELSEAIQSTKGREQLMAAGHQMYLSIMGGLNKRASLTPTNLPTRR